MSAGQLRHYVRLRIPPGTDDGRGGQTGAWTNGHSFWADIRPVQAREQAIAGALQSIATHRVRTYYDTRITVLKRLERLAPEGTELQIVGVHDVEGRQVWMDVDCAEVI